MNIPSGSIDYIKGINIANKNDPCVFLTPILLNMSLTACFSLRLNELGGGAKFDSLLILIARGSQTVTSTFFLSSKNIASPKQLIARGIAEIDAKPGVIRLAEL